MQYSKLTKLQNATEMEYHKVWYEECSGIVIHTVVCKFHFEVDPNSLVLEAAFIGKTKEMLDSITLD